MSPEFLEQEKTRKREYMRARRAADPEGVRKRLRAWEKANPEKLKGYRKAYRDADPEKARARYRNWYAADPEKVGNLRRKARESDIEASRAKERERDRRRRALNPDANRVKCGKRHARKMGAEGSHTASDIADQYARQNGKCHWCFLCVGRTYHVDHVVPLSRGGSDGPENIVIACPTCNVRKGAMLPTDFARRFA